MVGSEGKYDVRGIRKRPTNCGIFWMFVRGQGWKGGAG